MPPAMPQLSLREPSLFGECAVTAAVHALSEAGIEERGAIFTKAEVVHFILDLSGYTVDRPLLQMRLLEPSFGEGDFLISALDRLLFVWIAAGRPAPLDTLRRCILAVELHGHTFQKTRTRIISHLIASGISSSDAHALAREWLLFGDFLLIPIEDDFDVVVGNPPYVRQELIADALMREYRARFKTIYDRADIYVPFIEKALTCLSQEGHLGFICADRWMKNKYGGPLRRFVAESFHLKYYVDMVDTPAFHSDVVAYPAVTVFSRQKSTTTRVAFRPEINAIALRQLADSLTIENKPRPGSGVQEIAAVTDDHQPWMLEASDQLALVRRLERDFPPIEQAGCKVGIGVATGADKAFIGLFDELDVEDDRKLPLAMTRDLVGGEVQWRGYGVINPFGDDGKLVPLERYPRLRKYLEERRTEIAGRHVAQKNLPNWYRTIDRIYPEIAAKPKLLIPDIKGEAHITFENQGLYPHHNLYFITSNEWDLRALQAVLLSGIARLFVAAYSTKMRGGFLRFQAQYLRRIRIPAWHMVPERLKHRLIEAAEAGDVGACNQAAFELYNLSDFEINALGA